MELWNHGTVEPKNIALTFAMNFKEDGRSKRKTKA
jgi:hypothetical protein